MGIILHLNILITIPCLTISAADPGICWAPTHWLLALLAHRPPSYCQRGKTGIDLSPARITTTCFLSVLKHLQVFHPKCHGMPLQICLPNFVKRQGCDIPFTVSYNCHLMPNFYLMNIKNLSNQACCHNCYLDRFMKNRQMSYFTKFPGICFYKIQQNTCNFSMQKVLS